MRAPRDAGFALSLVLFLATGCAQVQPWSANDLGLPACDGGACGHFSAPTYFKPSNTHNDQHFGAAIALSDDGTTMVVGAPNDPFCVSDGGPDAGPPSDAGVDDNCNNLGAVYVFGSDAGEWSQETRIKPTDSMAASVFFGTRVVLSANGNRLLVVASADDTAAASNAPFVAVYDRVLSDAGVRSTEWSPPNILPAGDGVGVVATATMSADGTTVAIASTSSSSTSLSLYQWSNRRWGTAISISLPGYANISTSGIATAPPVALSAGGNTLVVGDSAFQNTNGDLIGAAFVVSEGSDNWTNSVPATLTPTMQTPGAGFGAAVAVSSDGDVLSVAVGAPHDRNCATGVNPAGGTSGCTGMGAVYVFTIAGRNAMQVAYVKANATGFIKLFGTAVALSANHTLVVGAPADHKGDSYVFYAATGDWADATQVAHVQAAYDLASENFGVVVCVNSSATVFAIGASGDDTVRQGIGSMPTGSTGTIAENSGAVYLYGR